MTANLLALAGPKARYAIIAEVSVQETGCLDSPCRVYALDTFHGGFARTQVRNLRPYFKVLEEKLCRNLPQQECWSLLGQWMTQISEGPESILARYFETMTEQERKAFIPIVVKPNLKQLDPDEHLYPMHEASFKDPTAHLRVYLEERWSVPSYRAVDDQDSACFPGKIPECKKERRWVDGQPKNAYVCPPPKQSSRSTPDCSGRASVVRVSAEWHGEGWNGSSALVEPGALAQNMMSLVTRRNVDMGSLEFSDFALRAWVLPKGVLVVGGFGHALQANGTWFPAAVMVPGFKPTSTPSPKQ